jgi:hypothetical protein
MLGALFRLVLREWFGLSQPLQRFLECSLVLIAAEFAGKFLEAANLIRVGRRYWGPSHSFFSQIVFVQWAL